MATIFYVTKLTWNDYFDTIETLNNKFSDQYKGLWNKLPVLIYFQVKQHSMLQNMIWRQVTYCNDSTKVQYLQRMQYYIVVDIWGLQLGVAITILTLKCAKVKYLEVCYFDILSKLSNNIQIFWHYAVLKKPKYLYRYLWLFLMFHE